MRALVTGAGGFLGRRLTAALDQEGIEVWTIGTKPGGRRHTHLAIPQDVRTWRECVQRSRPDLVFHLAGTNRAENLAEMLQVNVLFAQALLTALRDEGSFIKNVVLLGSAAEYGEVVEARLPITEQTPTAPCSLYGVSKLTQTILAQRAVADGHRTMVVRPFNLLGPDMPQNSAIGSFARQIHEIASKLRPPILTTGDLDRSRDFMHVDDAAKAILDLALSDILPGTIVNLCTGRALALRAIVNQMVRSIPIDIEIRSDTGQRNASDPKVSVGSPALITRLLGKAPTPPSNEQIAGMIPSIPRGR